MKKRVSWVVSMLLLLAGGSWAGTVELPQTGQTSCYDSAGNMIFCSGTRQDGDVLAGAEWPIPRFTITYCDSTAPCAQQNEDCDGNPSNDVVADHLTGLMWSRKACDGGNWGVLYWSDAVQYPMDLELCGYDDWRLPNANELESLIHAGVPDTIAWLEGIGFTDLVPNFYWTSTGVFYDLSSYNAPHYSVGFVQGDGAQRLDRFASYGMLPPWPVRSGQNNDPHLKYPANVWKTGQIESEREGDDGDLQRGVGWPDPRFTVTYCNNTGPCADQAADCDGDASTDVVTDNLTGLMWARDANRPDGPQNWQDALNHVKNLPLCGYTDWRLPNRKELHSLTDFSQHAPALPAGHPFTEVVEGVVESPGVMTPQAYWSSTTCSQNTEDGFCVSMYDGSIDRCTKNNATDYYLWPVRGGNTHGTRRLLVGIAGPRYAEAGGEYTFMLNYSNNLPFAVEDLVVQVYLPTDAQYVSSTDEGIYRFDNHEVFWKLGTVPAGASGELAVTIEFVWGIPPHTPEQIVAQIDAVNSPRHSIDNLTDYLAYEPLIPASSHSLTPSEIDALLGSDREFNKLYQLALGTGFSDYGLAEQWESAEGVTTTIMQLLKSDPMEVLLIHKAGDLYFTEKYETSSGEISIFDTEGGFSFDPLTLSAKGWGNWADQQTEGAAAASAPAANCPEEQWRCLYNCMSDKGLSDILIQMSDIVQHSRSASQCYACALGVKEACSECSTLMLKHILENTNKLNLRDQKINDIINCFNDCIRNPGSHYCSENLPYCPSYAELNWKQKLHTMTSHGGWAGIKMCDLTTCTYSHSVLYPCEACVGCNNGECDMFYNICGDGPEVLVGGDPNEKLGLQGNVIAGQQLDYTINYENYGEGTAFGVYITDLLDENLNAGTLAVNNGGTYYPSERLLMWDVGDVAPGEEGSVRFSLTVEDALANGTEIVNQATVYFPSVPEITPTNVVVNVVRDIAAHPQELQVESGKSVAVVLSGTASGGSPLSYRVVSGPDHGELTGTVPNLTYTASADYSGPDRFSFLVVGEGAESEPAEVRITVLPSASDRTPPTVVLTDPADNATDIPVSNLALATDAYPPVISVLFSEPVNPDTVNRTTFTVNRVTFMPANVTGKVNYDASLQRAFFTPARPLSPSVVYRATITTGVTDQNGNALAQDHVWQFTTGSEVDIEILLPLPGAAQLDFGAVAPGTASEPEVVTVRNAGTEDLVLGTLAVTGTDAALFTLEKGACSGATLAPGENCTAAIVFTPDSEGLKQATLEIPSNDPDENPATVKLSGTGSLSDTDGDGMSDSWEVQYGLNPRVDDASKDPDKDGYSNFQEYNAGTDPFVSDSHPAEPLNREIPLVKNWNLISLPLSLFDPAVEQALALIKGSYSIVWSYKDGKWSMYAPGNALFSDLNTLAPGYGYWIRMNKAGKLNIQGTPVSRPIILKAGWNLVGCPFLEARNIEEALAPVLQNVEEVWCYKNGGWMRYNPADSALSTLELMEPGFGYWIKVKATCTWEAS